MARWPKGEATIRAMLAQGQLTEVPGNPVYTGELLRRASVKLTSASSIVDNDPESAFELAYDAARFVLTALLSAQGLRPKGGPEGGHVTVQEAAAAQFGDQFKFFGRMRRLRNELQYPSLTEAATSVSPTEAKSRLQQVNDIVQPAGTLIEQLGLFR